MADFTVKLEYILPISKEYKTEILVKSDELYKDMLEYKVPIDTKLTSEKGDIILQLTFVKADLDAEGNSVQCVRKTSSAKLTIVPIEAWSNFVADSALDAIDTKILELDAKLKEIKELADDIKANQVDDLKLTNDLLQVSSNGTAIGDGVNVVIPGMEDLDDSPADGIIQI